MGGHAGRLGLLAFRLNLESGGWGEIRGIDFASSEKRIGHRREPQAEDPLEPPEVVAVINTLDAIEGGELRELRSVDLIQELVSLG